MRKSLLAILAVSSLLFMPHPAGVGSKRGRTQQLFA